MQTPHSNIHGQFQENDPYSDSLLCGGGFGDHLGWGREPLHSLEFFITGIVYSKYKQATLAYNYVTYECATVN